MMSKDNEGKIIAEENSTSVKSEWNRAIPEAGYIKLGSIRYGVRLSNPNLSAYPSSSTTTSFKKSIVVPRNSSLASSHSNSLSSKSSSSSSSTMSPSCSIYNCSKTNGNSPTENTNDSICGDKDGCCCIGTSGSTIWSTNNVNNSSSSKTRLPMLSSAKNRTSPSLAATLQQPNTSNKSSVSLQNLKRETSPTVCCYYNKNSNNNNNSSNNKTKLTNSENQKNCVNRLKNLDFGKNGEISENSIENCLQSENSDQNNIYFKNNFNQSQISSPFNNSNFNKICDNKNKNKIVRLFRENSSNNNNNTNNYSNQISEHCDGGKNNFYNLKDRIRKFEYSTNNNHPNYKNRLTTKTTTPASSSSGTSAEPNVNNCGVGGESGESVVDRDRRNGEEEDKDSESESDRNNNSISQEDHHVGPANNSSAAFINSNSDHSKKSCPDNPDDAIKITKVIIKSLTPILKKKSPSNECRSLTSPAIHYNTEQLNKLHDNDFSFIDSSSSVCSSSSNGDEHPKLEHVNTNQTKFSKRIPKINCVNTKNSCCNNNSESNDSNNNNLNFDSSDFRYKKLNNENFHLNQTQNEESGANDGEKFLKISPDNSSSSLNCFGRPHLQIYSRLSPEKSTNMEKQRRNTLDRLQRLGFGRKSSSSSQESKSHDKVSKTERLRELTEKLKGHKTPSSASSVQSLSSNSSTGSGNKSSVSTPPIPPPLPPPPPIPPPRRVRHPNSIDKSGSHSPTDSLSISSSSVTPVSTPESPSLKTSTQTVDSKSNVPTKTNPAILLRQPSQSSPDPPNSIFNTHDKSFTESLYKLLRPNTSVSNLENIGRTKDHLTLDKKSNSISFQEDELFPKLAKPESRTIVGSYIQKSIPFRSASFSQVDYTSGKYIKSDLALLKESMKEKKKSVGSSDNSSNLSLPNSMSAKRSSSPAKIMDHLSSDQKSDEGEPNNEHEHLNKYPLKSELSINLEDNTLKPELEDTNQLTEYSSKRNSDIETIAEEPLAEIIEENREKEYYAGLEKKLAQINIMQANEMTLETLVEEGTPISASTRIQPEELQTATTCLIPIPVFECCEKEWSPLPEHSEEDFSPIPEDVSFAEKPIECSVEIKVDKEEDPVKNTLGDEISSLRPESDGVCINDIQIKTATELSEDNNMEIVEETKTDPPIEQHELPIPIQTVPEVELNDIAIKLDEITEKLKSIPSSAEDICNMIKTQIPQSKEDLVLVPQKSIESMEEIRISPEIQEVLETVAETLNEEHQFLCPGEGRGSGGINIVSLICPESDLNLSDRDDNSKMDYLKAESSPEPPGSFDRSDSEFVEVRKRHSNNESQVNSGSDKSSPSHSPNHSDEKRKLDKSRRRKGIYIQWPAVEKSTEMSIESDSNGTSTPEESKSGWKSDSHKSMDDFGRHESDDQFPNSPTHKLSFADRKLKPGQSLELNCSRKLDATKHSDSLGSNDPNTPDSDYGMRPMLWPKNHRRQSLTYQSSDERDDPIPSHSPIKPFKTLFLRSESVSDNESDRGDRSGSRDRASASPAPNGDQDLKRYSKRPLRGPYGQMLEAEMKKPTKVHYDEILEELSRSDNHKKSNCSLDESHTGFFSRHKSRKSGGHLPVPMHTRTVSSPVPLIETSSTDPLPVHHKRYPSNIENRVSDNSFKNESKKLSLDSYLLSVEKSPKRTSSDITDKHSKKNSYNVDKSHPKRSLDEIRLSNQSHSERNFILKTPETPKNVMATPELLAQLLKGSSEKLLTEQNSNSNSGYNTPNIINSSGGIALPSTVLKYLDTRTHVVVELFNTEKSYVESLKTIVSKYMNPLKLPENSGIVDAQTVDEIFFMIPSILNLHQTFLEELSKRLETWDSLQKVGDAFVDEFSKPIVLETYTSFVNNWNKAKEAIRTIKSTRPAFVKFLESMTREHKAKLSLDNLLIKPVQKFPNYELIFQRLIKHTDADHPDQKPLQDALKLIHDILLHLNCKEREALENGQREAVLRELEGVIEGISDLVTPDRSFLLFELVSMPSGQATRKERGFFLFSDLLVITSIKKRGAGVRKPNTMPGSIASTLDTNKYKFLTKISLDDLEIVKSKDENVRRIMKEIEHLTEDCNKLQQMAEIAASLRCQHQVLEDSIRDLQRDIQRQLSERQSNDTQLSLMELTLNSSTGTQNMSIVFTKPEKRSQWEEAFNDAKQKLIASMERYQVPEFISSVPIRKTRAGLQFTCASPTLGIQKDVWVCNSDGYVGQVCVLSLNPEPTVTSCNGVCNARILCITSVPANMETIITSESNNNLNSNINISIEDTSRSSLLSISNSSTVSGSTLEKKSASSTKSESSNIRLDSSSSSEESETETQLERATTPSTPVTPQHKQQESITDEPENQQSTMWLGTEDGCIHVYNCTDNIRIKKNKIKIQHVSAVYSILYLDNRVFVSLANGDVCVYMRDHSGWNTQSPLILSIGTVTSPITKLLNVHGKLWCAIQGVIKILNTSTFQVENQIQISTDSKPITNMAVLNNYVWISIQNSAHIKCCHANSFEVIHEVNLAPSVNKMLSNCDDIIRQHKAACLRVTSLLACKDLIWVGTSAGVILTIMAQNICKGSTVPIVTGIPHGHTGHVRFLTSVDIDSLDEQTKSVSLKSNNDTNSISTTSSNQVLVISGGDGYEDFRNSGNTTMSEIAGREDSTNHLLLWQL